MASMTTDPATETIADKPVGAGAAPLLDEELARRLVEQAKAEGVSLTGPGGMLGKLTKMVLETALEAEMTAHPAAPRPQQPRQRHRAARPAGRTRKRPLAA